MKIKKYRAEIEQGIYTPADSEYYEYEYILGTLSASDSFYVALTAFDFGHAQTDVPPQETRPEDNARLTACLAIPGDANASGDYTLADILSVVNYYFNKPGCSPQPLCWLSNLLCRGDWNGSGTITLGDIIQAVNYYFNKPGGPWNALPSGACCLIP